MSLVLPARDCFVAPLLAMTSLLIHSTFALLHRALLDALLVMGIMHDALHEDAGGVDLVGLDLAGLNQVLDLCDRDLAGRRHDGIEVARSLAIDEVAFAVALPGVDDR